MLRYMIITAGSVSPACFDRKFLSAAAGSAVGCSRTKEWVTVALTARLLVGVALNVPEHPAAGQMRRWQCRCARRMLGMCPYHPPRQDARPRREQARELAQVGRHRRLPQHGGEPAG